MYVQYFYAAKQVVHTPLTRYYRVEQNKKEIQEAGQYYIAVPPMKISQVFLIIIVIFFI